MRKWVERAWLKKRSPEDRPRQMKTLRLLLELLNLKICQRPQLVGCRVVEKEEIAMAWSKRKFSSSVTI